MSEINDPACSRARLGRTFEDQSGRPSPKFMIIAESTDKSTDKKILLERGTRR